MDFKSQKPGDDSHLLVLVGIVLIWMIYQKSEGPVMIWLSRPINQMKVWALGGLAVIILSQLISGKLRVFRKQRIQEKAILGEGPQSVYCGKTVHKENVFIKPVQRAMHTQVVGTTNAGKTESVILPWAIQDIRDGRGLLLIDGKADNSLLNKLYGYVKKSDRVSDFKIFSLSHPDCSWQFNPLMGGTPEEITERVFNAFEFENPYYRSLQYEVMGQMMRVLDRNKITPTFKKLHQIITDLPMLEKLANKTNDTTSIYWVERFKTLSPSERDTRTSGLLAAIGHFVYGETGTLFNAEKSVITIDEALRRDQIVYFQLPVLLSPFLGKATGKLVLQSLQAAIAHRHRSQQGVSTFFSVFLDDFSEYLYPGFVSILNKSRSANVGIVFAHQALGDITQLGESVANAILTNSNVKIFMRGNDPESAEYFSRVIGTRSSVKYTERQKSSFFNCKKKTGDLSAREVEEFVIHPNIFKRELGVGEALMIIPHEAGSKTVRLKFQRFADLAQETIPKRIKEPLQSLEIAQIDEGPADVVEGIADITTLQSEAA